MITAIVRYRLPPSIGKEECRAHFLRISKGFGEADGLIRKQFIWNETGTAGGVYQWRSIEQAKRFYQGSWLAGILERYGMYPEIEYFTTFAITDNPGGVVTVPEE
ncbi:YdhR family protein [Roseomonas sp. NAR14]|uniref:YdhR family protein n=1 Tax=Roseomonas acroporae TaxID=2937791 RepID=A0A9X2BTW3_9PROT|nr:YdhR family protein [Roseomonas acroporae]MCK8784752.1 YdhR family protein [Roseomonas acroporae]